MQNQTLLYLILAVLTLATVVQAAALAGAFLAMRRLEEKVQAAEAELRALRPRIERLGDVIEKLADWTDTASVAVPAMARDVKAAVSRAGALAQVGALILARPLRPIGVAFALWKGLKRSALAYRELRPKARLTAAERG